MVISLTDETCDYLLKKTNSVADIALEALEVELNFFEVKIEVIFGERGSTMTVPGRIIDDKYGYIDIRKFNLV